ncbi:MAG TPA: hypothetical protein VFD32_07345 [Dehalococcoidia bacterium]|nr:hypothetical protein [Dehalococcoidia bacterium]
MAAASLKDVELHARLLRGDRTAPAELAERILEPVAAASRVARPIRISPRFARRLRRSPPTLA